MLGPQPKTIYVTQEDIHQGVCRDAEQCAIALALAHEYKDEVSWIEVENHEEIKIVNEKDDEWYKVHIDLNHEGRVSKFIEDFDAGKIVEPFSFNINEIEEF